jgi:hypothetical protein
VRIFLIQHGLKDRHAHFFGETLGWNQVFRQRRVDCRLFVHKDAEPSVLTECLGQPLFSFQPGERVMKDPISDRLEGFFRYSAEFQTGCAAMGGQIDSQDVVIVAFSTDREVYGVSRWLRTMPRRRRPCVIFIFLTPDFRWEIGEDRETVTGDISFHRFAANQMAEVSDRFLILASNEKLRRALSGAFNQRCEVAPIPLVYFAAEDVPGRPDDPEWSPAHIGVLGEYRSEKGTVLLPEIVARFRRKCPGHKIFLQVQNDTQAGLIQEKLGGAVGVEIHIGHLSQQSYIRRLEMLDILLLPYKPKRYSIRTSGIFAEAVAYGVVPVVPDNTWMSDQLAAERGSGVTFPDASVEGITNALISASERFPELKKDALARSGAWRAEQSTYALWDKIHDWLSANR